MQRDLAAAAEGPPRRRHDDRHIGVAQRLGYALEGLDHRIDLVPVAFKSLEQHQHQVGAGGKIRRVVADNHRDEVARRLLQSSVKHLDGVAADGVHL